jgi:hypothetical protein
LGLPNAAQRVEQRLAKGGQVMAQKEGMRGYNKGGCVTPKLKLKQPGYAKGGKIKLPPMDEMEPMEEQPLPPGPIGDVAQDTGQDTQEVMTRPGEYLLNPETVAFMGQGDYATGVRNLNQIVKQATGEEPGPEMVGLPEGESAAETIAEGGIEEPMPGFSKGGFIDDYGTLADPRNMSPAQQAYLNTPDGRLAMEGNTRAAQAAATAAIPEPVAVTRAPPPVSAEQAAWNAEVARQNSSPVAPQTRGERMYEAGVRGGAATRNALGSFKEVARNVAGPVLTGGFEVARQLSDKQKNQYYNDPEVGNWDKALQAGSDVVDTGLRWGAGTVAAPIGQAAVPIPVVGGALGFAGGYMAGDALWEGDNAALTAYRAAHPEIVAPPKEDATATAGTVPAPTAPPARSWTSPQGERYTEGFPDSVGNYLATNGKDAGAAVNAGNLRSMPGTDTKYAGRYGGQEVIVTKGAHGEPMFTGLRSPEEVTASEARAAEMARPKTAEEILLKRLEYVNNSWEPDAVRARANGTADKLGAEVAALQQAKLANAGDKGQVKTDKRISDRFSTPVQDENGQTIKYVEDKAKTTAFRDAMAKLGVDIYSLPEAQQDQAFDDFEPVYEDIALAQQAAKQQDRPISDLPRTGPTNSLRRDTTSNISLGDVLGPEATFGDWWRGVGNNDPRNDEFVVDPVSGARIPAYKALQAQGNSLEALRNYGYTDK